MEISIPSSAVEIRRNAGWGLKSLQTRTSGSSGKASLKSALLQWWFRRWRRSSLKCPSPTPGSRKGGTGGTIRQVFGGGNGDPSLRMAGLRKQPRRHPPSRGIPYLGGFGVIWRGQLLDYQNGSPRSTGGNGDGLARCIAACYQVVGARLEDKGGN